MPTAGMKTPLGGNEGGYALVAVLVAAALLSILASTAALLQSSQSRREQEAELLFRGQAYERAIREYYLAAPPGEAAYPLYPQDLLRDSRPPYGRHLRRLYPDPMGAGWEWIFTGDGRLMGIHSKSGEEPRKQDGFPPQFAGFAGAKHYSEWAFVYEAPATPTPEADAIPTQAPNPNEPKGPEPTPTERD